MIVIYFNFNIHCILNKFKYVILMIFAVTNYILYTIILKYILLNYITLNSLLDIFSLILNLMINYVHI